MQKLRDKVSHLHDLLSNLRTEATEAQVATSPNEEYNLQTDIDELHETMFSDPWADFLP